MGSQANGGDNIKIGHSENSSQSGFNEGHEFNCKDYDVPNPLLKDDEGKFLYLSKSVLHENVDYEIIE